MGLRLLPVLLPEEEVPQVVVGFCIFWLQSDCLSKMGRGFRNSSFSRQGDTQRVVRLSLLGLAGQQHFKLNDSEFETIAINQSLAEHYQRIWIIGPQTKSFISMRHRFRNGI